MYKRCHLGTDEETFVSICCKYLIKKKKNEIINLHTNFLNLQSWEKFNTLCKF